MTTTIKTIKFNLLLEDGASRCGSTHTHIYLGNGALHWVSHVSTNVNILQHFLAARTISAEDSKGLNAASSTIEIK